MNRPFIFCATEGMGFAKASTQTNNNNVCRIIYVSIDDNKHYMMSSFTQLFVVYNHIKATEVYQ